MGLPWPREERLMTLVHATSRQQPDAHKGGGWVGPPHKGGYWVGLPHKGGYWVGPPHKGVG